MRKYLRLATALVVGLSVFAVPAVAYASLTPNFTQTINNGALSAHIYDNTDTDVASPTVAFSAENYSFQCQTSTATLGDNNDRLNVTSLNSTTNTWNIAIAPTGGDTSTWSDGTNTYKFNDATGSGCTNGQMTVDPSVGSITNDCNSNPACTANASTVSKGTSGTYLSGSVSSVTLMSDSAGTAWEGYLTGVSVSQKVPALTPSGSYSLGMTITLSST